MGVPDPPAPRTCCMLSAGLASNDEGVGSEANLVEPSNLGHHTQSKSGLGGGGGGKTGIMYTRKLGFLDLGHLRDMSDLTKYVYDRLLDGCPGAASRRAAGTPGTCTFSTSTRVKTTHGFAEITSPLSDADLLPVAQSIAYDDSVGYEIHTYWKFEIGRHNSSFSPEDLPSNFLGTWVGAEAIKRTWTSKRSYEDEVDSVLAELVRKTDGQPKATTRQVIYDYVKGKWVHKTVSVASDRYLLRRNFTGEYWDAFIDAPVAHLDAGGAAQGYGTAKSLDSHASKYRFTFDHKVTPFTRSDYAAKIAKIRDHAKDPANYGPKYDSPSDPSFPLPAPPPVPPKWHPAPANGMGQPPFPPPPPLVPSQPTGMNNGFFDEPPSDEEVAVAATDDLASDADESDTSAQEQEAQLASADEQEESPVDEQPDVSESDDEAIASADEPADDEGAAAEEDETVAESEPEEDEEAGSVAEADAEEEESDAEVV